MTNNIDKLNILLIEDDPEDALLIRKTLEKSGPNSVALESLDQLQPSLARIQQGGLDIVLLDLFLPDSDGLNTLREIRTQAPSTPIVVLTNLDDESAAVEALNNGAQDYLVKGELSSSFFLRTIRHAIERQKIRHELNETTARLEQMTLADPLTGLLNRRGLQQILTGQVQRTRFDSDLLALLIDLDDFKVVNDTFGHAVGDVVLNEVTRRLKASLRATDYASRIGGDEFILLLTETRMAEGIHVAEKVRLAISGTPISLAHDKSIKVTGSLGLVSVDSSISSIDELLIATHQALSRSKKGGKNQVSFDFKLSENQALRKVHSELLEKPFHVLRHSIFNLAEMKVIGNEFLTRSAVEHFEMPDDFFRMSLENNILTSVDHKCLKCCLESAINCLKPDVRTHVNLFPSTLLDIPTENLIEELRMANPALNFCIEISEQQIIGDPSYLLKSVEELKKAGITVAIDDVGFGRSCFESLILLEPQIIKIDKRCISGFSKDKARIRSLKRILNVAHVLETTVIAEGIETKEDYDLLLELGVKYGQGYFLEKPVECAPRASA